MQQNTIYRVLTFVLLPFAALLGFFALVMFFIGLANPIVLLPVCIMACFTIYAVCCTIFLVKGIGKQQACKPSLKDWIKVNGYVTAAMAVMSFINSFSLLFYPKAQLMKLAGELLAAQPVKPEGITVEAVVSILIGLSYVMLVFSVVVLIQLSLSFRLLKKYQHLFDSNPQ
jgi:hypothetical protein